MGKCMINKNIFKDARFVGSYVSALKLGKACAEVAFVGRSNVGKSSLINALCGSRVLAKVSKTPGKTRTINVYAVCFGKWLVDLPGYGFANVSKEEHYGWKEMIESYLSGRTSLKAIFITIDADVGATTLDLQMLDWLKSVNISFRVIVNKIDRITQSRLAQQRQSLALDLELTPEHITWVSAKKGIGIKDIHSIISGFLAAPKL